MRLKIHAEGSHPLPHAGEVTIEPLTVEEEGWGGEVDELGHGRMVSSSFEGRPILSDFRLSFEARLRQASG
jgi:hypothetical protein